MRLPVAPNQPLISGQAVLAGLSSALVLGSGVFLWWAIPKMPASVPLHWSGTTPDRFGPPSELWSLWAVQLGLWIFLGLLAWRAPKGKLKLNGLPPITPDNAQWVFRELRTTFLIFQLLLTLLFSSIAGVAVLSALGGPNLMALPLCLVPLFPVTIGYTLYRLSYSSERRGHA